MVATNTQPNLKQIEDLTLRELDMIYSLSRVGEWSSSEIGRRYRISESDVRRVFDNYPQLREKVARTPLHAVLPQTPEPESATMKPRKRRSDAVFATAKERQAAYRARLKEKGRANLDQPSPDADTGNAGSADEELCVAPCQDSVIESSTENADPQHSIPYCSSGEDSVTSENMTDPITGEDSSQSEVLRVIEQ